MKRPAEDLQEKREAQRQEAIEKAAAAMARARARSLLERGFRYTPSVETDIRKTFARARRELANAAAAPTKVSALPKRKDATK
jgi:hypothetical protein